MKTTESYVSLEQLTCPVDQIFGVWRLTLPPAYATQQVKPCADFLLHYIIEGSYEHWEPDGHLCAQPGNLVIYSNNSGGHTRVGDHGIAFYSTWFSAPGSSAGFPKMTLVKGSDNIFKAFENLHQASFIPEISYRNLKLFAALLELLSISTHERQTPFYRLEDKQFRTRIEYYVKKNGIFRPLLAQLCRICDCSQATLIRECHRETGMTPGKFIQTLRMQEAYRLISSGEMNVTQTAEYLRYPSIHSFSREYTGYFGAAPTIYHP